MECKWFWVVLVAFLLGEWCECEGCWDQEKIALLQLKPFFNHIQDVENYWVEGKQSLDCCKWKRVECNTSTGRVIRLFLNQTYTEASDDFLYTIYRSKFYVEEGRSTDNWYLNASLFLSFEELKSLYLNRNFIAGCVYNQGFERLSSKLNNLEILDLGDNYFNDSVLASLSELSSLKSLYLANNQFTGSNHTEGIKRLSKLNKLETLDLHGNLLAGLKGTIDMLEFNNLTNLKELYLGQNKIESLGSLFQNKGESRLIKLEVLDLSYNLFKNSIFSSLAGLSSLKSLNIGGNQLEGSIHIKELNALSNLEELYMQDNAVNDFVPSQDNETELKLINLKVLDLAFNPVNNSILSFLGRLSNLKFLSLDSINLKGSIDLRVLDTLSNLEELYMCCNIYDFLLHKDTICSLPLQSLDIFPLLKTLNLGGFNFNGTKTIQKWQNLTSLEDLTLQYSSFPSNFIQDVGMQTSLKSLSVLYCEFNGSLNLHGPLHLKNLEFLEIFDTTLESNFFRKIGAMPSLKFLGLANCGLNGTLHTQGFCEMTNLQELYISDNNLKGNLPNCFSNLSSLESLHLSSNQLFGNISVLKSLTFLESLSLSSNKFSGNISVLKSLTFLESLDLSSNQFSGNISVLKSLTSLRMLTLSNNNFEIPSSLGPLFNLSQLKYIYADNNTIYAETEMHSLAPTFQLKSISLSCCGDVRSFPQFLYHQHDLQHVDLSNFNFTGQFPNWLLENNTNLLKLVVANNSFVGHFELPFLSHADLAHLDISKNSFYGNIPNEIGAKLPSLRFLNMSKNYFGGSIPVSIGDMNSLQILDLSNNKLIGGVPEHLAMGCSSLHVLVLSNNRLQGQMFSSNFNLIHLNELQLDGNLFSGRIPDCLSNCSFLSTLDVSNNQLFGEIPRWMGNMSSLEEIVMANNYLEGPIPMEFCKLNLKLKLLDLSVNNISGSLPSCFSPLWISQVHLSRNKLQGPLTNAFHNSTILVTLDLGNNHLTGNIPNWIGRLSQLSYLLLNNNHFEGGIPVQLCKLGHLSLIDLSKNNLSGTIPPCLKITTLNDISQDYVRYVATVAQAPSFFSTEEPIEFTTKNISYSYKGRVLTLLSGIDLSCNKLTGEIPHEFKNLQKIHVLNLSHNSLTGPIPPAVSDLKQIESLDLSYNNLNGKIPAQLVGLNYLSFFSVAYNNLSGRTPDRTAQFATFDETSYLGNPFLCGTPLPNNCSTDGPPSSMPKASTDNGSIDMNVFYVSFVVSYVMVLLCIASVLYINPYWRRAWFYHIEVGITSCYYFVVDNILPKRFHCGNM